MDKISPYSFKIFLAKLLANQGKVIGLLISIAVAMGYVSEKQGQDWSPIIIGVLTFALSWVGEVEAKKDNEQYRAYVAIKEGWTDATAKRIESSYKNNEKYQETP